MALERNKKINPGYFQQVLDISNGLSIQQRQFIQKIIDNVKKYNGAVTDKEYELLQRLKDGNFKYSTKNEIARMQKLAGIDEIKWTPEAIKQIASQYNSRGEFQKGNSSAYIASLRNKMLDDLFPESSEKAKIEKIKQIASQYNSRGEFQKGNQYAYLAAIRKNMLDDLFPKSSKEAKEKTKEKARIEKIKQVAALYNSQDKFRTGNPSVYLAALERNMLDDLFPKLNNNTSSTSSSLPNNISSTGDMKTMNVKYKLV
jgi:hypothetical protein